MAVGGPFFTFTVTKRVAPTIVRVSGSAGGAQSGTPGVTGYEKVNGFRYSFTNNAEGVVFDDNADITAVAASTVAMYYLGLLAERRKGED